MENKKTSLLNKWKNKTKAAVISNSIEKAPDGVDVPLSSGQKRLWFLQQMYPKNPFYNYSETYTFYGKLNLEYLVKSLEMVYHDHDVLKTIYKIKADALIQEIDKNAQIEIGIHDFSKLQEKEASQKSTAIMKADATRYFELSKSPLVRASIIKLTENKHILQITLHHIATDKWSMRLFRAHLAGYYLELSQNKALTSRKTAIQYRDYCFWLEKKELNTSTLNYWKKKLSAPIPKLTLPFDFYRPLAPSFKGAASFTQDYSPELSKQILNLSKTLETTPYNTMLAVFYIFLYKCSGQNDIAIGTPITNRDQKSLEDLIGFFNDTIVLRKQINSEISFTNFAKNVRDNTLEAFANKDIPFDILVKEMNVKRSLSINPFFQVMFLYHSKPENPFFGEEVTLSHTWYDSEVSKFDLTIYVGEDHGILSTTFEYAFDLFKTSTVNHFQKYFKNILESIVAKPHQKISEIQIISPTEYPFVLQKTSPQTKINYNKGIHNIIEDIALKHPNKKAVTFKGTSLTYKALNVKANALAIYILNTIDADNAVIGLSCERSVDMVIGILGILKAGCCYVPIDPEYPKTRIDFVLNDSEAKIIVTQSQLRNNFNTTISCLCIDELNLDHNENTVFPNTKENNLAYIIYTSGSTGTPKGVPISHKNIINSTMGRFDFYDKNPDAFLLMSSISFDSSKAGIFWTLCTGGNLVIAEKHIEQDIEKLGILIENKCISHTLMLPSLYNLMLDFVNPNKLKSLSTVIVAGEACTKTLCKKHLDNFPNIDLYNEYGPTEASVWCVAHKISHSDLVLKTIPIGKPVANSSIYILDSNMNRVPIGVSGEIFIGGPGLSNGYLNREDLTQEVFVQSPFQSNKKLYKTGDLGKYNTDGIIHFLGRADQQIKIRGFRVELTEIENAIKSSSTTISETVVMLDENLNKKEINLDEITNGDFVEILKNLNENELNNLFKSLKTLTSEEKKYLLNQI